MSRRVILTPPTINGETMPEWFYDRWSGTYSWIPPRSIREATPNARGELFIAGFWAVEWTWEKMHRSWWQWWTIDVLGGAAFVNCNVTIWSPNGVSDGELTTYNNVMVYHPGAFGGQIHMEQGMFTDVTIRIGKIPVGTLPGVQYWTVGLTSVGSSHIISS